MDIGTLLTRLFKWIRERFYGKDDDVAVLNRKERRIRTKEVRYLGLNEKYSGRRRYTPAPPIHY